ncbi:MAG TPA: hypothetical protein VFM65_05655 [Flavobacteriaceae bacterium]|nr:hypothetical protein [Flavobacteriaceae bacterium]
MLRKFFLLFVFLLGTTLLSAQEEKSKHKHHNMDEMEKSSEMKMMHPQQDSTMMMNENPSVSRRGSGTGWLPDAAPRYGYMFHSENWMYMLHGNVFLRYTKQDVFDKGTRGDEKLGSTNWIMGMGQTKVGKNGLFSFSAMLSLEALTVGGAGYPLLFQSGETWNDRPLVDHQHPHDLFSELSVSYKHAFSEDILGFVYLGYPGEPALGPVAFMHRPSGIYNSNTPLGHHWQDATHVTFGVATLGFQYKDFKVEGSLFTGTEPNEERYGFDEPRFNSQSVRLSYNPSENWAFQVSQAWLNDVHAIGPREDVNRSTASAIHAVQLGENKFLNSTLVWGYNNSITGHHADSHSILLESALRLNNTSIYGRYEWVQKSTEDLLLNEEIYGHGELYNINAVALGLQQKLFNEWDTNFSVGIQGRLYVTPNGLENVYGETPVGAQVYLRIYPGRM